MGGRGPAPKDPEKRRRKTDRIPSTVVTADGILRGPELPEGEDWPEATRLWWETWRQSAQAQAFTATDWSFLLDTAVLHAQLWNGHMTAAAELRLRVAKFGATPEDRARLRMQITDPEDPKLPRSTPGGRYGHLRVVNPDPESIGA